MATAHSRAVSSLEAMTACLSRAVSPRALRLLLACCIPSVLQDASS